MLRLNTLTSPAACAAGGGSVQPDNRSGQSRRFVFRNTVNPPHPSAGTRAACMPRSSSASGLRCGFW
jgi:hypothetical protein